MAEVMESQKAACSADPNVSLVKPVNAMENFTAGTSINFTSSTSGGGGREMWGGR